MAQTEYQRLTRTKSQHGVVTSARSSLWLGDDHLLRIDSSGYTENYRRFYLRDIQAVIIRKTIGMQIWVLVFGMLALVSAMFAVGVSDPIAIGIWWGLVGLFLLLLTINLLRGPCCAFHIKTAVQLEPIPAITRIRRAHQMLDRLRPLLAAAQGQVSREEILARFQPAVQAASADLFEIREPVSTEIPLATEIPDPTALGTSPESGPDPSSAAPG
jgi:hypothetical protein